MNKSASTVDASEIARFDRLAGEWWDEDGKYAILHTINPLRIGYIRDNILKHHKSIKGLDILDVGCGGGLVSAPLSRLGAKVTGIDASALNIKAAKAYAKTEGLKISFQNVSSEALAKTKARFDVIVALEIIEHVANTTLFIKSLAQVLKPGGLLFISTINRTMRARLTAKVLAEYVLRWVPVGTHDFNKFVTPDELGSLLEKHKIAVHNTSGMVFKPFSRTWAITERDTSVNYICFAKKALK